MKELTEKESVKGNNNEGESSGCSPCKDNDVTETTQDSQATQDELISLKKQVARLMGEVNVSYI